MADKGGAKARLEAAVKRLETAIDQASVFTGAEVIGTENLQQKFDSLNSELTKNQAENERLSEQLRQARSEIAGLQKSMDKIATRLDKAIGTVKTLLEEQPGTKK